MGFLGLFKEKYPPLKGGRTMFDGMSRQEVAEWIGKAPTWKQLSIDSVNFILDELYGHDYMDLFMLVSSDYKIVQGINQITKEAIMLESDIQKITFKSKFAAYLNIIASSHIDIIEKLARKEIKMSPEEFKQTAIFATNAGDLSIFIEPNMPETYVLMARLEWLLNRNKSAADYCTRCIQVIEKMENTPGFTERFGQRASEVKRKAIEFKEEIEKEGCFEKKD